MGPLAAFTRIRVAGPCDGGVAGFDTGRREGGLLTCGRPIGGRRWKISGDQLVIQRYFTSVR